MLRVLAVAFSGLARTASLAPRPPARQADGMARPLAKLISMLTPKRRWAQFSLLTMLGVVTLLCVGLRLVVVPAERQRRAVAAIQALGGLVTYEKPDEVASAAFPKPFLRRWLPRDYLDKVQEVYLSNLEVQVTDDGLVHLQWLTGLQSLDLYGTQVSDLGLAHLRGSTKLEWLSLGETKVTDAGLAQLRRLKRLDFLFLADTQVTDAGLVHLQNLTGLRWLNLYDTHVTDAGLTRLRQALPKCRIIPP